MKATTTSRQSTAPRAVSVASGNLDFRILVVVLIAMITITFLVGFGAAEGAPVQTPWQELGPASTAN